MCLVVLCIVENCYSKVYAVVCVATCSVHVHSCTCTIHVALVVNVHGQVYRMARLNHPHLLSLKVEINLLNI